MHEELVRRHVVVLVVAEGLEDGGAVVGSDFPAVNVLHELGFPFAIPADLFQKLSVAFGLKHGLQGDVGRPLLVLDGVPQAMEMIRAPVTVQRDSKKGTPPPTSCKNQGLEGRKTGTGKLNLRLMYLRMGTRLYSKGA